MYSENLDKLIELALADGLLTDKERQVLFKKAEAEGIDHDEFEMVIEGMLFEKNKSKTETTVAPISDKFGDVKKCPSCGAVVESFTTKCSDCGYSFRDIDSISSMKDFFRDYQKVEDSIPVQKYNGPMDRLFGHTTDLSDDTRKNAIFTKKKEFIMHFPIPNSREDILEFLAMAVPLASPARKTKFSAFKKFGAHFKVGPYGDINYDFLIAEVWMQKCEQIIMKAKFSMEQDTKTLEEIEYYAKQLNVK